MKHSLTDYRRRDSWRHGRSASVARRWRRLGGLALTLGLIVALGLPGVTQAALASQTLSFNGAIQTFTVPAGVTSVTIAATGASGGNASGNSNPGNPGNPGRGAIVQADYAVAPGQQFSVLAGGAGEFGTNGGGGGGSFVWNGTGTVTAANLLIAAGGGGGAGCRAQNGTVFNGTDASLSTSGTIGSGTNAGGGGSSGNGGGGGAADFHGGGGGGGGLTGSGSAGANGVASGGGGGGQAINAGAGGGAPGSTFGEFGDGGFGGGGGSAGAPGGGGGYSGGGGGSAAADCGGGGGGGSFISAGATNPQSSVASSTGNGQVVISWTTPDPSDPCNLVFQQPLDEGVVNLVQKGKVVPVKLTVECNGVKQTGLAPAIQLLKGDHSTATETAVDEIETVSVAAADTSGVMRPADGGYIYNLQIPSDATAIAGAKYTVKVTVNGASEYVVLEIRK